MADKPSLTVPFIAVFTCILWSTAFVGIKIGLRHCEPFSFAGIRFILSGLLLIPFWCAKKSQWQTITANYKTIIGVCFFQTFLLYGLFFYGMTMVSGALAAIVVGASPLTTAIVAHFFMPDDEMTVKKTACIALGIAGVAIIAVSRKPWTPAGLTEFWGILCLIFGTAASAFGNVLVAKDTNHVPPILLNSLQLLAGGLLLLALSFPLEGMPPTDLPVEFYVALVYLSVLSAAAFSIWFILLQWPGTKVSELNVWKFIIPVSGAVFSWWILPDESPTMAQITGMVLVAVSIFTFNLAGDVPKKNN